MDLKVMWDLISPVLLVMEVAIIAYLLKCSNSLRTLEFLIRKVCPNRKMYFFVLSSVLGMLPIPGRIAATSGVLGASCSNKDDINDVSTMAYLSSHHYYLWSPMEKSVIITCAGLGITNYLTFMYYMWPVLVVYLLCTAHHAYKSTIAYDYECYGSPNMEPVNTNVFLVYVGTSFFACFLGINPAISFMAPCLWLFIWRRYYGKPIKEIVDFKLASIVLAVIILGKLVGEYNYLFKDLIKFSGSYGVSVAIICSAFGSFCLGSSSKYAALTVAVCSIFGMQYLAVAHTADFIGYLLSPAHKCLAMCCSVLKSKYSYIIWQVAKYCPFILAAGIASTVLL